MVNGNVKERVPGVITDLDMKNSKVNSEVSNEVTVDGN